MPTSMSPAPPSGPLSHEFIRSLAAVQLGSPALALEPMAGGASLRRFFRARAGDRTAVVMDLGPEAKRSEEVSSDAVAAELPLLNIQRYLATGGIGVPGVLGFDEAHSLLYVEDLGDTTLELAIRAQPTAVDALYRAAIDELTKMQAWAADHPDPSCVAFSRHFDRTLLAWELEHFREYGLAARGIVLDDGEQRILDRSFAAICDELVKLPAALVHRDWQSRNLMVQDGRIRVVDFQDALMGHCLYDLVGLLRDSYVQLPPDLLTNLVGYFGATSRLASAIDVQRAFDLQTVQRKLKDSGRFVFIDQVKKNPGFLPYIPASLGYVRAALERLPDLAPLRAVLEAHCFT